MSTDSIANFTDYLTPVDKNIGEAFIGGLGDGLRLEEIVSVLEVGISDIGISDIGVSYIQSLVSC